MLGGRDGQIEHEQGYGDGKNPVAERFKTRRAPQARTIWRRRSLGFLAHRLTRSSTEMTVNVLPLPAVRLRPTGKDHQALCRTARRLVPHARPMLSEASSTSWGEVGQPGRDGPKERTARLLPPAVEQVIGDGSQCQSAIRDLAVGRLDGLGGFPDCLVPDSGHGTRRRGRTRLEAPDHQLGLARRG
jgi:hypothetical protein